MQSLKGGLGRSRKGGSVGRVLGQDVAHAAGGQSTAFIAADIGGTSARIGLVRDGLDGVQVLAYQSYPCAGHASLEELLREFIQTHVSVPVGACVLGCPGRVDDDGVLLNNYLPWPVSRDALRSALGIDDLWLINDFEALAYAAKHLDPKNARLLTPPRDHVARGAQVVVGPGTGLGSAVLMNGSGLGGVLATEAGQIALAPGNPLEAEMLAVLAGASSYVSYDRVLSGPGLLNLYGALCTLRGAEPVLETPESLTATALADSDPLARQALEVFCALLGSFTGDLAMLYGATGGVWLAGGFLSKIHDFLVRSDFIARFLNKGLMREFLENIPIRLIEHGQLGVVGSATWYVERQKGSCRSSAH